MSRSTGCANRAAPCTRISPPRCSSASPRRPLRSCASPLLVGAADSVTAALELLPSTERDADVERLFGEALQMRGDWDAALASFARATEGLPAMPASIAWRVGLIHHLRGHIDEALAAYESGLIDGSDPGEEAVLLSWSASAHWLRGARDTCRQEAPAG